MKNGILKERLLQNYFRPLLSGVCVLLVAATVLTGCTSKQEDTSEPAYTIVNPADCVHIPTQDQITANLAEIFQSPKERYLRKRYLIENNFQNIFYRFPCPQNGEKIKVNFLWDCTEQDKTVFLYAINHYNQIFSVINPYYQFEANFAPTTQDILNPYSINVNHEEEFKNNTWLGYASVPLYEDINEEYGYAILENKITLKSDLINISNTKSSQLLANVFLHEFGHCLGFGDAYKNKDSTEDTIMQEADGRFRLSETDIKVLNALYHEPKNQNSIEEILEILDNRFLEENNPLFPYKSIRPVKDFFENIVQIIPTFSKNGMTPAEYLKSYVNESDLLSNEEKAELSELIGDDLKYNETIDEAKFTYKYKDSNYESASLNTKNLALTRFGGLLATQHEGIRVGPAIVVNYISTQSLEDLYNYEYPSSLMVYFQLGDYLVGWEIENVIIKKGTYKIGDPSIKMKKENKDLTTNQTIQPSAEKDFSK